MFNRKLKSQVEECLKRFPETRNSDITLTISIWIQFYENLLINTDGIYSVKLRNLFELPREDNVKRIRCKFTEKGKYLPTEIKIFKQRKINEELWRSTLGYCPELRTI